MSLTERTLSNGVTLPALGLGTYGLRGLSGVAAVASALESGYRLLDTALSYGNESEIGEGLRASGIPRADVTVTTKLPGRDHGFDETFASFEISRGNLGLDYVDLYLIHWPLPRVDRYVDSWRAMIELRDMGLIRSIGVSNFTPAQITRLVDETGIIPAVNQVELHPRFPQAALRAFHTEYGILTESWSPIGGRSDLTHDPTITAIAEAHGVTPTQAVLRWHIQLGAVPIPKSANAQRQRQNLDVGGFELTDAEVAEMSSRETGRLWGGDPATHEEF
jgi:diketogulonate reductase-like aldo/keto reductase